MDLAKSCNLLDLNKKNLNANIIKKAYHKKALIYHPDKNNNKTNLEFLEIKKAYENLNKYIEDNPNENIDSFNPQFLSTFFSKFINLDKDKIQFLKDNLLIIFNETSLKILKQIDEDNCLKIIKYIEEYKDLFEISNSYLERILNIKEEILSKKEIIILNPSINNLLNGDIYIFNLKEQYCVPLWHNQVEFDNNIIVKIIPQLNNSINIDENNNLYFDHSVNIKDLIDRKNYSIPFYNLNLNVNVEKIKFKTFQTLVFEKMGIPKINLNDLFSIQNKSNIYINLQIIF